MRKLVISIALIISCVMIILWSCQGEEKSAQQQLELDSASLNAARGEYLTVYLTQCLDCHSKRDHNKFSLPIIPGTEGGGGDVFGANEGVPGEIVPPNITPFKLKDWTDEEIARAITQGINKNGDTLFPLMPYHSYNRLTSSDLNTIISYIRALKPIEATTPPKKLMITPAMYGPLPQSDVVSNVMPDPADKVNYGQYLVTAAVCGECHTPRLQNGAPDMSKAFSGGFTFRFPSFEVTVANITPDSATGIGSWTEQAFIQKFKTNASPAVVNSDPGKMNTVMPWSNYGMLSDADLSAIYAYLRSIPAVNNKVVKWKE